jgi:alpha-methylacyl-CoA racemase
MRRAQVDLKSDAGRATFLRLAARADVVLESFRPGVVDRLGIGYDDVRGVNDDIVYCSTSGFGQTGPYAQRAGHDLDYLALGGYLDCTERAPGDKPPVPGATIADAAGGGMQAAMAIIAALFQRGRTGQPRYLDVSITDGVLWLMGLNIDEHLATGAEAGPGRSLLTGRYACYDTYRCADDRWVAVGAIEATFFANLCRALGCDQWIDHQLDDDAQDKVRADIAGAFATRPRDEWIARLADADTCVAPIYSVSELVSDAHLTERGLLVDATTNDGTTFRQLGPLMAGSPPPTGGQLPDPGATDTDDLLVAAGLTRSEIAALREQGAVA